ncbi:MAG: hypothetical protein IPK15_23550 [Verrucomicrobia bacterium]|nr:hypothetical protein [Verrucomicrobiota bacterium]
MYGSFRDPNEVGSGGGSDSDPAGNGGGLVRISVGTLSLEGQILANGGAGSTYGGGGSGGGIKITAGTLSGGGSMQAIGGSTGSGQPGGGGGGRIAVYYGAMQEFDLAQLSAEGGDTAASRNGASGTIFVQQTGQAPTMVVRGNGRETPLPATQGDEHLILDNALVSATNINVSTLVLTNGAVLTHPGADTVVEHRLLITANTVMISTNSRIDVTGRGYLGGRRGGNGDVGRTIGNTAVGGSLRRNGGSYGGVGGFGSADAFANAVYGSFRDPNEVGSGGGTDVDAGGNGGGLIRMTVQTLVLQGQVLANGGDGDTWGGGGGGGGIKITATKMSGSGIILANGGRGFSQSGGGGGGRVAVYYNSIDGFDLARVQTLGGVTGARQGTPGTVYLRGPAETLEQLVIDAFNTNSPAAFTPLLSLTGRPHTALAPNVLTDTNASFDPGSLIGLRLKLGATSPVGFTVIGNSSNSIVTDPADGSLITAAGGDGSYSAELAVGKLILRGGAKVELMDADKRRSVRRGKIHAVNLELVAGSVISHPAATSTAEFGVELVVDDTLVVDTTNHIDASALGYLGGNVPGNGGDIGRTLGNTTTGGSTQRNGGSYGGSGAFGSAGGTVNLPYGDSQNPNESGSGGGSDSGPSGSGGGWIRMQSANLVLNGSVLANGGNGSTFGGGGSGGGIRILARNWSGSGQIRANGGAGGSQSGGGGGGRIAIVHENDSVFPVANISTTGGTGFGFGASGSVVVERDVFVPPASVVLPALAAPARPLIDQIVALNTGSGAIGEVNAAGAPSLGIRWAGKSATRYVLSRATT